MKNEVYMRRQERVVNFVKDFYTHADGITQRSCWQCRGKYINGDKVHLVFTAKSPNRTLCSDCALELRLLDVLDLFSSEDD